MSDHLDPAHDPVRDAGRADPSQVEYRPLAEFLPDNGAPCPPRAVTVAWTGQDTVMVGRVTGSSILLAPGGSTVTDVVPDGLLARPVTDRVRERELYQRAITALAADLGATGGRLVAESGRHRVLDQRIDDIRQYAIDRHHDGDICRDGLDRFLTLFEMAPHDAREPVTVRFSIAGSYRVHRDTPSDAVADAERHLGVEFVDIAGLVEDSDAFTVTAAAEV